ncbi:MAG: sigma-54 dependent transcriptional regulator [Pseudomonadota bacterium]|nr:sigma-54 dependent transcriptional regulator [Pseudomonadota bacterium]
MSKKRILVVDDEAGVRFGLRDYLETHGYDVLEAESCHQALDVFLTARPDAAIVDYKLPDGDALSLLPRMREIDASVPLIVLTAHGSIDLAVRAIKEGAEQFLTKPIELPALQVILRRLLDAGKAHRTHLAGSARERRAAVDPFLGASGAIRELAEQARKVLEADSPILIQGETGTGKGVLAAWLHRNGPRASEAFVDLNCAGLSREFLESELFGHEKGAFTGAVARKQGLLEIAHAGTVFLDEIGDVDPQVQPKLLKVIEEKRYRMLGDVRERYVDIHLVAATHADLGALARAGKFRSDLYFRISAIPLVVPPLRERGNDVLILAKALLGRISADLGRGAREFTGDAERALLDYHWPGNVRELRNILERAVLLGEGHAIGRDDLRFQTIQAEPSRDESMMTLLELERRHIERVLREVQGKVELAARRLGIPRSTLYQKLKEYGLTPSRN